MRQCSPLSDPAFDPISDCPWRKAINPQGTIQAGGKGAVSPVSDTNELLRDVRASARESYYKRSSSKYLFFAVVVVVLLAIAVVGLKHGGFLGIVLAVGGAFGLALVSLWTFVH